MDTLKTKLSIIGRGSAGFGAAISATKSKIPFILIEKLAQLGETNTNAFFSNCPNSPTLPLNKELFDNIPIENNYPTFQKDIIY